MRSYIKNANMKKKKAEIHNFYNYNKAKYQKEKIENNELTGFIPTNI